MSRRAKQTVDYYPHYVADSRTRRILQRYWANDGYAVWHKLLEMLCAADGHYLNLSAAAEWEDFLACALVDDPTASAIMDKLCELGKIDAHLWQHCKVVWCQNLVDNLKVVYSKRSVSVPDKPGESDFRMQESRTGDIPGGGNPQSKVEYSRVEESNYIHHLGGDGSSESLTVKTAGGTGGEPVDHSMTSIQSQFAEFWAAYPRKVGKQDAMKVYKKLKPTEAMHAGIMAALVRASSSIEWSLERKQFIPHPATWLNRGGWDDEFTPRAQRESLDCDPDTGIPYANQGAVR